MAKRSVSKESTEIDPLFHIPDGVDELHYHDDDTQDYTFASETTDGGLDIDLEGDSTDALDALDDTDYEDAPETPQVLDVFMQTVRRAPDGTEVVDVIFDVSDVSGITNYELRVTAI